MRTHSAGSYREIEPPGQRLVLGDRDIGAVHDPFARRVHRLAVPLAGRHGVHAPMNEHAEPRVAPPLQPSVALGGSFLWQHLDRWCDRNQA